MTPPARPVALLITPVLPENGQSGRALRAWGWLRTLGRTHDVHVLVVAGNDAVVRPDYPAIRVWYLTPRLAAPASAGRIDGRLPPMPVRPQHRRWGWARMTSRLDLEGLSAELAGAAVDRIVVFRLYLHIAGRAVAKLFPSARLDLDLDDLESATCFSVALCALRLGQYRKAIYNFASSAQFWFMQRLAKGEYATAYLATRSDVAKLHTRLAREVTDRPNRVTVPPGTALPPDGDIYRILFVGTLGYPPNEEAARFIAMRLLPKLVRDARRTWRVRIVGHAASASLAKLLEGTPGVEFVCDAVSLTEHYAISHVAVVPLFAGGGMKLKTLEAFAHQRPVISTSQGVSGLLAVRGEHYVGATTVSEFATAILELAADPDRARRIAGAGYRLCRDHYQME